MGSAFIVVAVIAVVLIWSTIAVRLVTRHHQLTRFDALLIVFAFGATVDLGNAAGLVSVHDGAGLIVLTLSSLPGLLICVEVLRLLNSDTDRLSYMWTWRAITTAATGTLIAAIIIGQPTGAVLTTDWLHPAAMTTYWFGYGIAQVASCAVMTVLAWRFVRTLPASPLRQVVVLVQIALLIGLVYGVALFFIPLDALGANTGFGAAGYDYGTLQYIIIAVAYLRLRAARTGRRGRDARTLTAVATLQQQLQPVHPGVQLTTTWHDVDSLSRDELSLACVRASVELRDWMHLLAVRLPADAWQRSLTTTRRHLPVTTPLEQVTATATAVWVTAGLRAPTNQRHTPYSPTPPHGADIDADLALLVATATVDPALVDRIALDAGLLPDPSDTPIILTTPVAASTTPTLTRHDVTL